MMLLILKEVDVNGKKKALKCPPMVITHLYTHTMLGCLNPNNLFGV